jgi:TolA-binding protein
MKALFWLAVLLSVAVAVFLLRHLLRKHAERERASQARAAHLVAQMAGAKLPVTAPAPVTAPVPASSTLETQKLLFEAGRKAGEAGEHALAAQLYERFLARFPDSNFAIEVRAAVAAQKKLIKA